MEVVQPVRFSKTRSGLRGIAVAAFGVFGLLGPACELLAPLDAVNEDSGKNTTGGADGGGEAGVENGGSGGSRVGGGGAASGEAGMSSGGGTSGAGPSTGGAAGSGPSAGAGGSAAGGGSAGAGGSPGGPPVTTGLTLWLDANATGQAGPAVATWQNLAQGGESDATQSSVGQQPELTTVNGLPGVLFEGDDLMNFEPGFADYREGMTIFAVAKFDEPELCAPLLQASTGQEINDISFQSDWYPEVNTLTLEVGNTDVKALGILPKNLVVLLGGFITPTGGGGLNVNGLPEGSAIDNADRIPFRTARIAWLGSGQYDNCTTFHGVLFELLLYKRALSTRTELGQVTDYLRSKWRCCGN
jgi:hypothetical protein